MEHTFKNSIKPATPRLMSKVIVENFPSRNEFHELVEGFQKEMKDSNIQNEFQIEHKQSCIEIKFYDDVRQILTIEISLGIYQIH